MKNSKIMIVLTAVIFSVSAFMQSCKEDERVPPDVVFKTGGSYTSANATVAAGDTVLVGITADKTEDELSTFNVSYAYDGAATTTTATTESLTEAQEEHFETDYEIVTRSTAGSERWVFTITDRDGNITSVELTLTVI